ncbi:YcgN family cysteine cluster protein [Marinospirillum perlucidum]|uniref:YcgN family cysteine cluster protein n=1 Tax=Marinospirillum perlucidum TaxID=1982602 RepID=UPI000DF4B7CC|nr:YcgN family cysteine cluster protein [Marinospirillum perlucidum]
MREEFWTLPLSELTTQEWEALCDGCGRCCLHKLQDEEDDQVYYTDVACHLFDPATCRCRDYSGRLAQVPDCMSIREEGEEVYQYLPRTCAYRLRHENQPLPFWHPLITRQEEAMRLAGISVQQKVISEADLPDDADLEERIINWVEL